MVLFYDDYFCFDCVCFNNAPSTPLPCLLIVHSLWNRDVNGALNIRQIAVEIIQNANGGHRPIYLPSGRLPPLP
jgi:hypothetical protein